MAGRSIGEASMQRSSGPRHGPGSERQRFHDLRHAFATLLLDAGEEVAVISKMLGHADYSTTVDVYSHLSADRSRVAAARIDGLLKRREVLEEVAPVTTDTIDRGLYAVGGRRRAAATSRSAHVVNPRVTSATPWARPSCLIPASVLVASS